LASGGGAGFMALPVMMVMPRGSGGQRRGAARGAARAESAERRCGDGGASSTLPLAAGSEERQALTAAVRAPRACGASQAQAERRVAQAAPRVEGGRALGVVTTVNFLGAAPTSAHPRQRPRPQHPSCPLLRPAPLPALRAAQPSPPATPHTHAAPSRCHDTPHAITRARFRHHFTAAALLCW
jgi:hypothetical protein